MGLTIHFQGHLRSPDDYENILQKFKDFANRKSVKLNAIDVDSHVLIRVIDGKICEYESPLKVISLQPHEKSDSLILEFDRNLYIQQFCKTQFAGIPTHVEIIEFLREIEPFFKDFQVNDEGDYWNTNSITRLEQKFADYEKAFKFTKRLLRFRIIPDIEDRMN
jgi:hypothetical protein